MTSTYLESQKFPFPSLNTSASCLSSKYLKTFTLLAEANSPFFCSSHEVEERAAFTKFSKKDLSHCAEKFKARGIEQRSVARRAAKAQHARQKRGLSLGIIYTSSSHHILTHNFRCALPSLSCGLSRDRSRVCYRLQLRYRSRCSLCVQQLLHSFP